MPRYSPNGVPFMILFRFCLSDFHSNSRPPKYQVESFLALILAFYLVSVQIPHWLIMREIQKDSPILSQLG